MCLVPLKSHRIKDRTQISLCFKGIITVLNFMHKTNLTFTFREYNKSFIITMVNVKLVRKNCFLRSLSALLVTPKLLYLALHSKIANIVLVLKASYDLHRCLSFPKSFLLKTYQNTKPDYRKSSFFIWVSLKVEDGPFKTHFMKTPF